MTAEKKEEQAYIIRRRIKAFFYGLLFLLCRVFPVDKNKIVMWTFEGSGGYGCSPKYIAEEILKRNREGKTRFKIFWLLSDPSKPFPKEIIKIKDSVLNRAFHMTTARFWISNTRTFYGTKKRKGTTYFQTWHGTVSLKPIGKYRGEQLSRIAYLVSEHDSKLIDCAFSGSRWCTEMWTDGLIYDGEIEEAGSPRCDVLINSVREKHVQLRTEYGLAPDTKIMVYAPTFRGGSQSTQRSVNTESVTLDFERLIHALEARFGGTWVVFLRLHPQLATIMDKMPVKSGSDRLIDVSKRPDMNEILAAADAMITDYSTAIFEGFLTGMPGFIYADDLQEYVADRGMLMFKMDEIPFPVAYNNDMLIEQIRAFDEASYREACRAFIDKAGIIEDGKASERIADRIEKEARIRLV